MAIIQTVTNLEDIYKLEVGQDSSYILYYKPFKTDITSNTLTRATRIEEKTVLENSVTLLGITKDGYYELQISAEGETTVIITIYNKSNLQNSIIKDALLLLCDDCGCYNSLSSLNCVSIIAKKALKYKATLVKLMTYQNLYINEYSTSYFTTFNNYVNNSLKILNCKIQNLINEVLINECIDGSVKDIDKLFKTYLGIYWAGMYFIEKAIANNNTTQLEFLKVKYFYDKIITCICKTCLDIDELEDIYNTANNVVIYSYQFDGIEYTSDDINLLTESYLDTNGSVEDVDVLESGKNIIFSNLGRVGFVIYGLPVDSYKIYDVLNNDITDIVFDSFYDPINLVETFVSKQAYVPSTLYFKFIKQ